MLKRSVAAALATALALAAGAAAQDAPAPAPPPGPRDPAEEIRERVRKGPFHLHGDYVEYDEAAGVAIVTGDVRLEIGGADGGEHLLLYAESAVIWGRVAGRRLEEIGEIYAEGQVSLSLGGGARRAEVAEGAGAAPPPPPREGQSFEADALYLDLAEGEGQLLRATVRSGERGALASLFGVEALLEGSGPLERSPFLARARLARISEGFTLFEGEDVIVSTCTFGEPHFNLASDSVIVRARRPDPDEPDPDAPPPGAVAELRRPRVDVLGTPVFLWPFDMGWDTAWTPYVPRVRAGENRRFGYFLLSEVPLYIQDEVAVEARLDYMSERGGGFGGNVEWRGPAGERRETYIGFFEGYYIHDRAREDVQTEGFDPPPDRGRIRLFHRDDLPYGFRREAELSWISDRGFLPEYFEREAKTGKEQETVAYLRWLHENMGATVLGRWRLNDFQTQTEYLPRGRWTWIGEPFLTDLAPDGRGLYLTSALELANARRRFDEDEPGLADTDNIQRADLVNRIDYPRPVGPLVLDPFATVRYTSWTEGATTEDELDRLSISAGALATIDIWRDFTLSSKPLGIAGVRHVMTPSSGYVRLFYDDLDADDLIFLDAAETVRKGEFIPISLRNRLVADRGNGPYDVVDLLVETRYFPRSRLAVPQRPFLLEPGDVRRTWDLIRADLRVYPHDGLRLIARADVDPEGRGLVREDTRVDVFPTPDLAFHVGHRYFEDRYDAVEAGFAARATEKWWFAASMQYDFEDDEFVSNELTIFRSFHRFVLAFMVDADFGEDDVRFAVNFTPKDLFARDLPFLGDIDRSVDPLF